MIRSRAKDEIIYLFFTNTWFQHSIKLTKWQTGEVSKQLESRKEQDWRKWSLLRHLQSNVEEYKEASVLEQSCLRNTLSFVRIKEGQEPSHRRHDEKCKWKVAQDNSWIWWILADNHSFPRDWSSRRRLKNGNSSRELSTFNCWHKAYILRHRVIQRGPLLISFMRTN